MARITDGSSMLLMIRMAPLHFGQTKGSTFPVFAGTGPYFLNKSRPVPPEDLFIPLRLDDGGNGVIVSLHLPFTP
jgi:hypothetical protein